MSRSGYCSSGDLDPLEIGRWRAQVASSIRGKRGQSFLKELAAVMDATPETDRRLIKGNLIDENGDCCTIGVVCKARGLDVSKIDVDDPQEVGDVVGISYQLAAEIEFQNDECDSFRRVIDQGEWVEVDDPYERWNRIRQWVEKNIAKDNSP